MQRRHIFIVLAIFLALLLVVSFAAAKKQGINRVAKDDPFVKCVTNAIEKAEKCSSAKDLVKQVKCKEKGTKALDKCTAKAKAKGKGGITGGAISDLGGAAAATLVGLIAVIAIIVLIIVGHRKP